MPDNYLLLVIRMLLRAGLWVVDVGQPNVLIVRDGFVKQRPGNPLLYLYQEGEMKRGQAKGFARAIRATIFTLRTPRQGDTRYSGKVGQSHQRDTAHYRGVSMCRIRMSRGADRFPGIIL